jgi:hypothetical protein
MLFGLNFWTRFKNIKDIKISLTYEFYKGILGTNGPKGLKGADGLTGTSGDKGISGQNAEKGKKGDVGDQAEKGLKGIRGSKGSRGLIGHIGEKGLIGYFLKLKSVNFFSFWNHKILLKIDLLEIKVNLDQKEIKDCLAKRVTKALNQTKEIKV